AYRPPTTASRLSDIEPPLCLAPKESMQPSAPRGPPTTRERDAAPVRACATPRGWLRMEWPALVRGRFGTGASCPSCNLAREAATLSLVTRLGADRRVDPVGETALLLSPLGPGRLSSPTSTLTR